MTNQMTFPSLIGKAEAILSVSWRSVYEERQKELTEMFVQYGDRAYGVWIQQFMAPVLEFFKEEGYQVKSGFNRADSVERWGPPEERERCIWYVVKHDDGTPAGTMVLQVYHSHIMLHFPRPPRLFPLETTEREQILSALSDAATRVRWDVTEERLPLPGGLPDQGPSWEYATDVALADCLRETQDGQLSSWTLDEALCHWGRYGWELISVAPSGRKLVAFFRRRLEA